MNLSRISVRSALLWTAVSLPFASPAAAQNHTEHLHEAYYLQHETGDLKGALALYEKVATDRRAPAEVRRKATQLARAIGEELASADFARLVPEDTIFYAEFNRPGEQLRTLLDQLGLLGASSERLGISAALVDGVLGMRGAAIAITDIDPRRGPQGGVAILHPGDLDVVRGLIETALPAGGRPVEPIGDYATYSIEGEAFVTMTSRLIIAGRTREDVAGVVARMEDGGRGSLARNERLGGAMSMRGQDLMFFCVNLEPVMPMIMDMVERETRRDPEVRAALAFFDLQSARTVAGRCGVDDRGMSLDMVVELDEGHRNLAFNLMRMPNVDEQALSLVPAGPALFAVGAVNREGSVPPGETDARGRPVVTAMDFGRELFANVTDVAMFVMPKVQRAPWGAMPDVGIAMRVNDPQRSLAMWQFLLGTAQAATGGKPAQAQRRGDATLHRFDIEGVPVFLAHAGKHLVLSPSPSVVDAVVEASQSGESVLRDPVYAEALATAADGSTFVAAANLGRCSEIGKHFMSERDRREMDPWVELMSDTTLSLSQIHTANRCGVRGRIVGIPDVGPMVSALLQRELHGRPVRAMSRRRPSVGRAEAPRALTPRRSVAAGTVSTAPSREAFDRAHATGQTQAARSIALAFGKAESNPMLVNNLAWALLTEEQYGNQYDAVALKLSKASNVATDWGNWYYLDTYARALFQNGSIDEAITMQEKAIAVGAEDPRIDEAKQSLQRYLAAAKERKIR